MDVIVIGGGQAGLATAFYLQRAGLSYVVLDSSIAPGGSWRHTWPSMRLFSPAAYSSLPGRQMPRTEDGNPDAAHVISYLTDYERRYGIPVERGMRVDRVRAVEGGYEVHTDRRTWRAPAVVSATGTWSRPFIPACPGRGTFLGRQLHSARYAGPADFAGRRVMVVGGANSGAQIAADLAGTAAEVLWCTLTPPRYLPDDVDGRELFRIASARVRGEEGAAGVGGLGDIVVVPPVRAARDAGALEAHPVPERFIPHGAVLADGTRQEVDDVIWCTGFRPALGHLQDLDIAREHGRIVTDGPRVPDAPGLYLVGYGDWCGPASATLIGVGQWARAAVEDIVREGPRPA